MNKTPLATRAKLPLGTEDPKPVPSKRHPRQYWIKERYNPQLGTYFVAEGQMSKAEAKRAENALYGSNIMHAYDTEAEYQLALSELRKKGERFQ